MTKRKQRTRAERSERVFRAMIQYYKNKYWRKYRPTYFRQRILPKVYDFRRRLSLWIYPKSDCFSCCLTCKYYNDSCRDGLVERMER